MYIYMSIVLDYIPIYPYIPRWWQILAKLAEPLDIFDVLQGRKIIVYWNIQAFQVIWSPGQKLLFSLTPWTTVCHQRGVYK